MQKTQHRSPLTEIAPKLRCSDGLGGFAGDRGIMPFLCGSGGVDRNHSWGARAVGIADAGLALGSGRRVAGGRVVAGDRSCGPPR